MCHKLNLANPLSVVLSLLTRVLDRVCWNGGLGGKGAQLKALSLAAGLQGMANLAVGGDP